MKILCYIIFMLSDEPIRTNNSGNVILITYLFLKVTINATLVARVNRDKTIPLIKITAA